MIREMSTKSSFSYLFATVLFTMPMPMTSKYSKFNAYRNVKIVSVKSNSL
jgi:hypothetical protein